MFGVLWGAGLAAQFFAAAQGSPAKPDAPDPINPDRPNVANSTYITPKGLPIVELGIRQTEAHGLVLRQFGDGPLFRIGINSNFELRLSPGSYDTARGFGSTDSGLEDSNIAFKWRVKEGKDSSGWKSPSYAIFGGTTLPTGSAAFREETLQPAIGGIVSWSLNGNDEVDANVVYSFLRDSGEEFGNTTVSAAFSHQFTPKVGSYIEAYSSISPEAQGGTRYLGDLGLTYLVNNGLQLDIFAGSNIDSKAWTRSFGLGVSYRF